MDVILLERVEKLGIIGDVVNVKPGYARNYLLPQGKALRASDANKAEFETRRSQIEADNLKAKDEAEAVSGKMEGTSIVVIRQASDAGMLYGSVNTRDIAMGIAEAGFEVSRQQIILDKPIKMLGLHDVRVRLHPEVSQTVQLNIAKSADEAEAQLVAAEAGEEEQAPTYDWEQPVEAEASADADSDDAAEASDEAEAPAEDADS